MRERSLFGKHSMLDAESTPKVKKLKKKLRADSGSEDTEPVEIPRKKKKKKKKRPDDRYMDEFVQERTKAEARSDVKKKAKKRIREIVKSKQEAKSNTGSGFKQLPVFSSTESAKTIASVSPVVSAVFGGMKPKPNHNTTAVQAPASVTVPTPAPVPSGTTAQTSTSAPTPSNPSIAAKHYYADLPLHERVFKLAQDGQTNDQIAIRLGVSIKQVMDIRKEITTKSLIGNPRDLFARRLKNFEDCFDTMLQVFDEDPTNEVAGKSLTDFMKEMRELTSAYRELDDPREVATTIVNTALRPMVMKTLKAIVDGVNATAKNVTPYLRESEKQMVNDGLRNSLKSLQDNVNDTYNASVQAIAQLYEVDLSGLLIKKEFRASQAEDSA